MPKAKPAKTTATVTETGTERAAVEAACAIGDGAAALTAALAWWTRTRAPAVADLVDAISARISPPPAADDVAFARLARTRDPLDLGALLPAIPNLAASFLPTAGELLGEFPDDPRLAIAVATWALDPPTTSSSSYPFWTRSLDAMVRARDVRVVPLLNKRIAGKPGDSKFWPKFYAALKRAVDKLADESPAAASVPAKLVAQVAKLTPIAAGAPAPRVDAMPVPELSGPLLEQAAQHLAAGRIVAAIDAMLERWRADRAPELADVIDAATRLLPSYDLPLPPVGADDDPWLVLFERDASAAMPQLLQAINAGDARYGGRRLPDRRLAELANLPDDPRVALRLAELCSVFGVSPQRTQYWKSLLQQLARIRDPRTWPPLRATFRDFTNKYFDHHKQAKRLIGELAMTSPAPPKLPDDDLARVATLAGVIADLDAATLGRKLVAAIAAAPAGDDQPHLVYADWLMQREHPRGKAVSLDCASGGAADPTPQRFEVQDRAHIYGALNDACAIVYTHLDRGLPVRLDLGWGIGALTWRAMAAHPLVALVETIDVGEVQIPPPPEDLAAFARAATRLRAIERVEQDREKLLWAFADDALPDWKRERGSLVRA